MNAVDTVKSNVDIADDVDRLLVDGNTIQDGGQFVVERLLCRGSAEPGRYTTRTTALNSPTTARTQTISNVDGWLA